MRFVVAGAGAVGGVVGARLHQAGRRAALDAAGIDYEDDEVDDLEGRWAKIGVGGDRRPLPGRFLELSVDDVMAVAV